MLDSVQAGDEILQTWVNTSLELGEETAGDSTTTMEEGDDTWVVSKRSAGKDPESKGII